MHEADFHKLPFATAAQEMALWHYYVLPRTFVTCQALKR